MSPSAQRSREQVARPSEPQPQELTSREEPVASRRDIPSLPQSQRGERQAVWSNVPVFSGLGHSFLESPRIPKAPAPPKLRLELVEGRVRIVDTQDDELPVPTRVSAARYPSTLRAPGSSRLLVVLTSTGIGFCAGLLLAWMLGVI